jgi:hypothetical protein
MPSGTDSGKRSAGNDSTGIAFCRSICFRCLKGLNAPAVFIVQGFLSKSDEQEQHIAGWADMEMVS